MNLMFSSLASHSLSLNIMSSFIFSSFGKEVLENCFGILIPGRFKGYWKTLIEKIVFTKLQK